MKKNDNMSGVLGLILIIDFFMVFIIIARTIWLGFSELGIRSFVTTLLVIPFVLFIYYLIKPKK